MGDKPYPYPRLTCRYHQSGGCGPASRGCAAWTRQALENANNDIVEVRRAANQVVHCKCLDDNCSKMETFIATARAHKVQLPQY